MRCIYRGRKWLSVSAQVTIDRKADWWLGDLDDAWFQALESAIRDEWGVTPLRIREGGVRPSIASSARALKDMAVDSADPVPGEGVWLHRAAASTGSEHGASALPECPGRRVDC